jgi:hypothetical protein
MLEEEIGAKEQERERLVKRMGLLDDDAARVAAARINELTAELRDLRGQFQPQADRLEALRDTLSALLEQTRQAREAIDQTLPARKWEAVRQAIGRIYVQHREVLAGTQRRSEVVRVKVVPHVGASADFRDDTPPDFRGGGRRGRG